MGRSVAGLWQKQRISSACSWAEREVHEGTARAGGRELAHGAGRRKPPAGAGEALASLGLKAGAKLLLLGKREDPVQDERCEAVRDVRSECGRLEQRLADAAQQHEQLRRAHVDVRVVQVGV